jgi:hypothetical protein
MDGWKTRVTLREGHRYFYRRHHHHQEVLPCWCLLLFRGDKAMWNLELVFGANVKFLLFLNSDPEGLHTFIPNPPCDHLHNRWRRGNGKWRTNLDHASFSQRSIPCSRQALLKMYLLHCSCHPSSSRPFGIRYTAGEVYWSVINFEWIAPFATTQWFNRSHLHVNVSLLYNFESRPSWTTQSKDSKPRNFKYHDLLQTFWISCWGVVILLK